MLEQFKEFFGGFKNMSIELEKTDININERGFSIQMKEIKPTTERLPEGEIKLLEDSESK